MEENFIKTTTDTQKAESILKMVEITVERVKETNKEKYSSNIIKDYYEILRELMAIILLLDGYKTIGEGAHKALIEYIEKNYKELNRADIVLLNEIRIVRNKIAYDGFFIEKDYLERKWKSLEEMQKVLKKIVKRKLNGEK